VATAGNVLYARIWCSVFAVCDSGAALSLTWMPAHTKVDAVGCLELSDGSTLSSWHRDANAAADGLAKSAAARVRVPSAVRLAFDRAAEDIVDLGVSIGRVTAAANAFSVNGVLLRDSTASRRRPHPDASALRSRTPLVRSVALGGHSLRRAGGIWRCTVCRRYSGDYLRMCGRACSGPAVAAWALRVRADALLTSKCGADHSLMRSGSVLWCRRCGSFSSDGPSRAVGLVLACPGRPNGSGRLARLLRGVHPTTKALIGNPLPVLGLDTTPPLPLRASSSSGLDAMRARIRAREAAALQV
jgi:hypothetical protein